MKTERELFLEWLKKEYPMMYQWYSDGLEEWKTKVEYMFVAWQARVPEGYVVVPKEPSDFMRCTVRDYAPDIEDFENMNKLDWEKLCGEIYKAMIEAAEK